MKKKNKLLSLLLISFLSILLASQIYADSSIPDLKKTGSISVSTIDPETKKPVEVGNLSVYKVAVARLQGSSYAYEYVNAFSGCNLSLADLQADDLAFGLFLYAQKNQIEKKVLAMNTSGKGIISNLECGLYLVAQDNANVITKGYIMSPFLVTIPLSINNSWVYTIDATPKMEEISPDKPKPTTTPTPGPSVTPTTPPGPLPQTGQLWWPVPLLAITGVLLVMIGWINKTRTRK